MALSEHLWKGALLAPDPANASVAINLALQGDPGKMYTIPKGDWICKDPIIFPKNFVGLSGPNFGGCRLIADDTGSVGGQDFIQMTDVMGCRLGNLTLSSTGQRAAGAAIAVTGADPTAAGIDVLKPARHVITDVDMDSQFIGLHVMDSAAAPSWLLYVHRGYWRAFTDGGYGIWQDTGTINPPAPGASQFYQDIFIVGQAGLGKNSLSNDAIRVSGGGDFTFLNVETWAWKHGFHCDAPASRLVQACHIQECLFDSCGEETFLVAPDATADCTRWKVGGLWIGNGLSDGIKIVGPGAYDLQFDNVGVYSHPTAGKWGVIMDGTEDVTMTNVHITNGTANGFQFTGNAANCGISGRALVGAGKRWQVDAGCNKIGIDVDGTGSAAGTDAGTGTVIYGRGTM